MKKNNAKDSSDNMASSDQKLAFTQTTFLPSHKPTISKNSILITSIKAKPSTINKVLETNVSYNDDIYIFEITGKTQKSPNISWNIYKNNKQIRELFEKVQKDLPKKEFEYEKIINICKLVKKYTNGEICSNLDKIANYIIYIYNTTEPNQPTSLKEGLRISKISFSNNDEIKIFEGYALKRGEPRFMRSKLAGILKPIKKLVHKGWNKRWIILKDDMISYLNNSNSLVGKNVYWFDEEFKIITKKDNILKMINLSKTLKIKFDSKFERDLWKKEIEKRVEVKLDEIINNPYHSFASQKTNCGAKWFVDGDSYFSYLLEQLKTAKETVYITDWFMSPELALKRPINYDDFKDEKNYKKNLNFSNVSRLMDILYLLAEKGVKVNILLFCEVKLALAINSLHAKTVLNQLHSNIRVTRHPKGTSSILWSHHEKLVIIDQKIAFVGGLDLCWGRYDTNQHPIVEEENKTHKYYYPGADYVNERRVDMHDVDKFYKEQLNRNEKPRMGWHDVHTMIKGPIVSDLVRHFVERWNDARFNKKNSGIANVGRIRSSISGDVNKRKKTETKNKTDKQNDKQFKCEKRFTLLPNMLNKIKKKMNMDNVKEDEKDDEDDEEEEDDDKDEDKVDDKEKDENENISKIHKKVKLKQQVILSDDYDEKDQNVKMDFKIQALRSVSSWSIGKDLTERSILEGYYKLIDNSKHYIYIENQFFITKTYDKEERRNSGVNLKALVQNEIGLHIKARIEKAYAAKENFKVFICIPLLPGFSGTPGESSTMNCILKYTFQSISHNRGMSLLEQLHQKMGDEVNKYIYFFSLRNHGTIKGIPVADLIYIHSKLLIVDDEKVIIGSANINDRSMDGSRDSEFAVIIEEEKKIESIMDGKKYVASHYALSLRKHLMAEHLGLKIDDKILDDPLNNELWMNMISKAQVNTQIYSDIWDCYPDNKFNNFAKLKKRRKFKSKEDIEQLKKDYKDKSIGISGHIVEYPIHFLKDEELDIDFFSKENLVPERNFI